MLIIKYLFDFIKKEKYVHYKLQEKGITNVFLTKTKYNRGVYLSDEDFKKVLPKMEKLIKKMSSYTD
jgi:hypothetical protein